MSRQRSGDFLGPVAEFFARRCLQVLWVMSLAFNAAAQAALPAGAQLKWCFEFTDFNGRQAVEGVSGCLQAVRHGVATRGVRGAGLLLVGHPDQALELGAVGFDQPATFALWIKRAASTVLDRTGVDRPEYQQEQERGQGRLLSRAGVRPDQHLPGALRVGPEKLEVWHGRGWAVLISAPIPAETWVHLTVTFDAQGHATGYLNGRRGATVTCGFAGQFPLLLAAASGDRRYGFPFAGAIDDVRLYQGVLDDSGIAALAAGGPSAPE